MVADLNVYRDLGVNGITKPHAPVMLSMREASGDSVGAKVPDWNRTDLLECWRGAGRTT